MKKTKETTLKPQIERVEKLLSCIAAQRERAVLRAYAYVYHLLKLPKKSLIQEKLRRPVPTKKALLSISQLPHQKECKKYFDPDLFSETAHEGEISPHRVKNCKDYLLASKRLKNIETPTKSKAAMHQVTFIEKKGGEFTADKKDNELWRELLQHHEERQFHLTRITKFLLD